MTVMENHDKCVRAQYVIYNKSLMIITFIKDNEPAHNLETLWNNTIFLSFIQNIRIPFAFTPTYE